MFRATGRTFLNLAHRGPSVSCIRQPFCINTRQFAIKNTGNDEDKEEKPSKIKAIFQKYGYVAVGTYLGLYVVTLSSLFVALDYDLLHSSTFGFDPVSTVKTACDKIEYFTGVTSVPQLIRENPRAGTFAIAWIMTKFTEPFRLAGTMAIVPKLGQYVYDKKFPDDA